MAKKSPGSRANATGKDFERDMARRLRQIYDSPSLLAEIETATAKTRPSILRQSSVRRGEQRLGAREPDVVTPTTWWFELQCSQEGSGRVDGTDKLAQAERDIRMGATQWIRPVVIYRRKGSNRVWVTLYYTVLACGLNWAPRRDALKFSHDMTVTIAWEAFETILKAEKAQNERQQDSSSGRGPSARASAALA